MQRSRNLIIVVSVCAFMALMAVLLWPQPQPATASHVAAISAGGLHTCALTTSGGVQCWGRNDVGQLGNGTLQNNTTPVDVVGLEIGVVAIASGAVHTCALTTEGGVQCWGNSTNSGGINNTAEPIVGLETGVSAITGGFRNACALTTSGGVKCWGSNFRGALGDGTTTDRETPVDVLEEPDGAPLSGAVAIGAGGDSHTCVLTTIGSVKCWGRNNVGQLGNGTLQNSATPVDVLGLDSGAAAVAAGGGHTCALTDTGGVKCWGYNTDGQLGNGVATTDVNATPEDVLGLETGVAAISPGASHTCALLVTGGVQCWGQNFFGQVGDGTSGPDADRLVPVDVPGLSSGVVAVSAGLLHTCALTDTGAAICWGANNIGNYGQTGDSDGDGCTDFAEHGTNAALGGRRDHLDYWDFLDVPTASGRDFRVDGFDIAAVVLRFGTTRGTPPTQKEALAEALTPPTDTTSYHAAFDRDSPDPEANVWNVGPPNGRIDGFDIAFVVVQFGHTCL